MNEIKLLGYKSKPSICLVKPLFHSTTTEHDNQEKGSRSEPVFANHAKIKYVSHLRTLCMQSVFSPLDGWSFFDPHNSYINHRGETSKSPLERQERAS